jgi:hypothetical protein
VRKSKIEWKGPNTGQKYLYFPRDRGKNLKEPCISLEIQRFQAVVNTLNALSPFDKKYLHRLMNQKPKNQNSNSKIKNQNTETQKSEPLIIEISISNSNQLNHNLAWSTQHSHILPTLTRALTRPDFVYLLCIGHTF